MSDILRPLPFDKLMKCLGEYSRSKTIFGVRDIYRASEACGLETPVGLAAGPNTQLAQNIIAGYAAGARVFEVKTVQTMDGDALRRCVPRPCILTREEGYNVEWSTELTVEQALDEYVKAYFALNLIGPELGLGKPEGFVFNMSVGYDLKGIKSEKIDNFIEGMKDARRSPAWKECLKWAADNGFAAQLDKISPKVSDQITLSTLHGCPKDEIERIAEYLIVEKGLNTRVKCNPTLLGYEFARKTLDNMGYGAVAFGDGHFKADLQYNDAVDMFARLKKKARERGLDFGVKLSNTMPVDIKSGELPGSEMYMSGKALYPLTISLAAKLAESFAGDIDISYCGGADWQNCEDIYACGICPITMTTTILKPGGYNRLAPIARRLESMEKIALDPEKLTALAEKARGDCRYSRPVKVPKPKKLAVKSPIIDCFTAPCSGACPINQDIPEYLALLEKGDFTGALSVICDRNPLPNITGTICTHRCQTNCTRAFYDESVKIRAAKLEAAEKGMAEFLRTLKPGDVKNVKIAIIGGGPAGMAAAHLAARAGAKVTLFEREGRLGGVAANVIPDFRISKEAVEADAVMLEKLGVEIRLNQEITQTPEGFDRVIAAVGAEKHRETKYPSVNAIDYLKSVKLGQAEKHARAVVVGGGNTAMDAARAAKRLCEKVTIVYRRTVSEMPAEYEELKLAMDEGVEFMPLHDPVSFADGRLTLNVMRLGEVGKDGRRETLPTGETREIPADIVVSAIGEGVDREVLARFPGASVVGDAKRGPATVVEAIADATFAVNEIIPLKFRDKTVGGTDAARREQGREECINCPGLCTNCLDVCPNRANVAIMVDGKTQILHVDDMCNECGACEPFCPYAGKPCRDKFTYFSSMDDFEATYQNDGFLPLRDGRVLIRLRGKVSNAEISALPREIARFIEQALAVM